MLVLESVQASAMWPKKTWGTEIAHYMYVAMQDNQELVVIKIFYNYRPCSTLAHEAHTLKEMIV